MAGAGAGPRSQHELPEVQALGQLVQALHGGRALGVHIHRAAAQPAVLLWQLHRQQQLQAQLRLGGGRLACSQEGRAAAGGQQQPRCKWVAWAQQLPGRAVDANRRPISIPVTSVRLPQGSPPPSTWSSRGSPVLILEVGSAARGRGRSAMARQCSGWPNFALAIQRAGREALIESGARLEMRQQGPSRHVIAKDAACRPVGLPSLC